MQIIERKWFTKPLYQADIYIKKKIKETLSIFYVDPKSAVLNNHALQGSRKWQRSINVTGDWRIIFKELSDGHYELVELIELGTHSQLYG